MAAWVVWAPERIGSSTSAPTVVETGTPRSAIARDAATSPLDARAVAGAQAPGRTTSTRTALVREFLTVPRYKELHQRLAASPARTAEEDWVLATLLSRCARKSPDEKPPATVLDTEESVARFSQSLSPRDPTREKRIAALRRVHAGQNRCAGMEAVVTSPAEIADLFSRAAAAGDPKARYELLRQGMAKSRKPGEDAVISDENLETIKELFASRDAIVMQELPGVFAVPYADFSIRAGPNEESLDWGAFMNAWRLAACDAGAGCGADHPLLAQACASGGECDAKDFRDYVLNYQGTPRTAQRTADYYAAVTRILDNGDWSYFAFVRGPNPMRSMFVNKPRG